MQETIQDCTGTDGGMREVTHQKTLLIPIAFHQCSNTGTSLILQKISRYSRLQKRRTLTEEAIQETQPCQSHQEISNVSVSVGTDLSMEYIESLEQENDNLKQHVNDLEFKITYLENKTKESVSVKSIIFDFRKDNQQVKFYTDLPSAKVFLDLLTFLLTVWLRCTTALLPPAEHFLMALMKLRLGLTHQDLAFRFNTHICTVANIFHGWLDVMSRELQCLIHWPPRKEIKQNVPHLFKNKMFNSVRCIIDCSEIFIQRLTSLHARALIYSNYKSHNTIKFLLGVNRSCYFFVMNVGRACK